MPASRCARCRWTPSRPAAARCAAAWRRSTEPPRPLNAEARKNEKLRPVNRPLSRLIVPQEDRKRVVTVKGGSVRFDLGGRSLIKKKKKIQSMRERRNREKNKKK